MTVTSRRYGIAPMPMDREASAETVSFGAWVRRRRRALDLTQSALGDLAACTESAIRKIESDERRPSRRIAERLADALRVPADERERFMAAARGTDRVARLAAAGEPDLDASSLARLRGNLPARAPRLVGREAELARIEELLADPACRILTILGPGGIGKTQLALAAAARLAPRFADGAWMVPLAEAETSEALLSSLARVLGTVLAADADVRSQLHGFLRRREALLVLDNFEQLLAATGEVTALAEAMPGLRILVTTRERLNVRDEWLLPLEGLALEGDGGEAAALRLFRECAARVRPDFPTDAAELAEAAAICARVEGMPLGIELAAAWTRALSCAQIAREIEKSADFLRSNARDVAPRHASLRAVFDHSVSLLGPGERHALARVAVFRDPFDRAAAEAVAGADLAALLALADSSLLRAPGEGGFGMHELVRQFARELLAHETDGEEQRILDAHSRYFLELLADEAENLAGAGAVAVVERLAARHADLRVAWLRALERGEYRLAAGAVTPLFWIFEIGSRISEGADLFKETVGRLGSDPRADATAEGRFLLGACEGLLAWFLEHQGRYEESLRHARASIARIRSFGRSAEAGVVLANAARAAAYLGRGEQARALIAESDATISESTTMTGVDAAAHGALGMAHLAVGELEPARRHLHKAIAIQRGEGQPWTVGSAHYYLGEIAMRTGDLDAAREHWQQSARHWMRLDERHPLRVLALSRLGSVAAARGDGAGARSHLEQALRHAQEVGFAPYVAHALIQLGDLEVWQSRHEEALALYRRALGACGESGNRVGMIRSLMRIARAREGLGDRAAAYAEWAEAARLALEAGHVKYAAEAVGAMVAMPDLAHEAAAAPSLETLRERLKSLQPP